MNLCESKASPSGSANWVGCKLLSPGTERFLSINYKMLNMPNTNDCGFTQLLFCFIFFFHFYCNMHLRQQITFKSLHKHFGGKISLDVN